MSVEHAKRFLLTTEPHSEDSNQIEATLWNAEFISGLTLEPSSQFRERTSRCAVDDLWRGLNGDEIPNLDIRVAGKKHS